MGPSLRSSPVTGAGLTGQLRPSRSSSVVAGAPSSHWRQATWAGPSGRRDRDRCARCRTRTSCPGPLGLCWALCGLCGGAPSSLLHTPCGTSMLSASRLVACRRPRPRPSASSPAVTPAEGPFRFLVRHRTKAPVCECLDDSEVQGPSAESARASRPSCRRWRAAAASTARAGNAPCRVSGLPPFKQNCRLLLVGLRAGSTSAAPSGSLGKVFKIEMCIIFNLFFLMFLEDRF